MPLKARCGRADEIPPGGSKVVQVREHTVAIFNLEGTLYAIDNVCPHQGGPLGEGYLEEDGTVSCPWHAWNFDVRTGISPVDPEVRVTTHRITVQDGEIIVEID
ncbi:MAG TPA: Rieske (2Fe-2S) protein [Candidatus Polarisedimenticolia bacterium]|nr:Rieske (2Fe-2S) protein [Candidatus Polarisedimenticolia bacterium]